MSTRSTTHFVEGDHEVAIVYRHSDGYPEGQGTDLYRFFEAVEEDTQDTRFGQADYLAAKFVVWLAEMFATESKPDEMTGKYEMVSHFDKRPLDFLSVGIMSKDPGDVEYIYVVDCGASDVRGHPVVTCYEADHSEGWNSITRGEVVPIPLPVAKES